MTLRQIDTIEAAGAAAALAALDGMPPARLEGAARHLQE